ncbi:hypothetical protein I4F81_002606 [Pyropia yezoensis]|uniref:Uncharacterized protein n=1 Tax=Pyropia yezoensis TaxID=2788 RepID=A0ACC3BPX2_PYRYE|nr:hypothetical protein I4F81_002606 [Neopyropia yezoensis]
MAVIAAAHYAGSGAVLSEDGAAALAADVEFVLRETVQEALKFMRHAKRTVLTGGDIEDALRLRGMEPLYGVGPGGDGGRGGGGALVPAGRGGGVFNGGPAGGGGGAAPAGVDLADAAGWPAGVPRPLFRRVDAHLYVAPDAMVDVREAIRAPLPRVPLAPSFTAHWLALDGVQPSVPENPPPGPPPGAVGVVAPSPRGGRGGAAAAVGGGVLGGGVGAVGPAAPGVVPPPTSKRRRRRGTADGVGGGGGLGPGGGSPAPAEVLPVLTHELSNELQLYYQHVISAVRGGDALRRDTALASVAVEPGLSPLLPYLTRWVHNEVDASLRSLPSLLGALRLVGAVLANGQLGVEAYLHQLLPPVLTCLVGRRLCGRSREDHWALRDYAAGVVGVVVSAYAGRYTSLQPRITKTLVNAVLDPGRPLTTHYGATVGLAALGGVVVERLLLPHVAACWPALRRCAAGAADLRALGEAAVAAAVPGYTAARLERLLARYGEDRLFPFRATDASALHERLAADAAVGKGNGAGGTRGARKTLAGGGGGGLVGGGIPRPALPAPR